MVRPVKNKAIHELYKMYTLFVTTIKAPPIKEVFNPIETEDRDRFHRATIFVDKFI